MSGAVPLLLYAFMAWTGTTLLFQVFWVYVVVCLLPRMMNIFTVTIGFGFCAHSGMLWNEAVCTASFNMMLFSAYVLRCCN